MATPGMWMNANNEGHTAAERGIEAAGAAGSGEPTPARMGGEMTDEGYYCSEAAQQQNAAQHGRPAIEAKPSNLTGAIEDGNANSAESDIGIQQYPHYGPPPRTSTAGGSGNPYEGEGGL